MGLILEPAGIDLQIYPSVLTEEDRQAISSIIAQYKLTGEVQTLKPTRSRKGAPVQKTNMPLPKKIK